jgi:hypothetical protein
VEREFHHETEPIGRNSTDLQHKSEKCEGLSGVLVPDLVVSGDIGVRTVPNLHPETVETMKANIFLIAVLSMSVSADLVIAQAVRKVTVKGPDAAPKIIKRPTSSDEPAKAIGTEAVITDGKVTFDLKGQSWDQVLQWLADTSKLSLDWQELPGDTLNLTTTRSYTLEEARDIVNRHLLARGFSMVRNDELLSVVKIGDIKSSLVPRVDPEDLESQLDHTLCKVSFDLSWLIADEAVEELKPLLSTAGTISKLSRTNRLEVMDTARSLKDIYRILQDEQSDTGQEQLVRTFRLKDRRASEVIELLRTLLGLDNEGGGGGGGGGSSGSSSQMSSMMRQMQQQMQKMSSAAKGGVVAEAKNPPRPDWCLISERT